jgi:hypothetical protein
MFSYEHYNKIKEMAEKNGDRNPQIGKVMVAGNYKCYTFMTRDPETYSSRYSDAKIIMSGDIRKIRYTEP